MFSRQRHADPVPCLKCHNTELRVLDDAFDQSTEEFWVYDCYVPKCCSRCNGSSPSWVGMSAGIAGIISMVVGKQTRSKLRGIAMLLIGLFIAYFRRAGKSRVSVAVSLPTVGIIERNVESSRISSSGSDFRAHGSFISHLMLLDVPEKYKQSLLKWAPHAMIGYDMGNPGYTRMLRTGRQKTIVDCATASTPASVNTESSPSILEVLPMPPANDDCEDGKMLGTQVEADAYGVEERVTSGGGCAVESKILGIQIGPSLIETEVMETCESNLKAGLAKRVQPLPFKKSDANDKLMIRKIEKTVSALIEHVFPASKIKEWREQNPMVEDMKSKKWNSDRWRNAFDDAMMDVNGRIEQTFQIKQNEALPAKGKAPRPIIQCGDRAQAMMMLPVKCFEELLFHHFEEASIKHLPKHDAMARVAKRLRKKGRAYLIEGDGSAWDSCCNPTIRSMTENRIMRHIIEVLGEDHEVPRAWMMKVLEDMEKPKLKGKAKIHDFAISPVRVMIESIRQSGHRGTSCFNYLINLVCWLCVVCERPWEMVRMDRNGRLPTKYVSAFDNEEHELTYAFEGDDSALSSTQDFYPHQERIEELWTRMGFRMKLVFVDKKLTFTGFDFLCDSYGPTGAFVPEIARNVASSSWSCSAELKSHPERVHKVGAAAMLARAENFKGCGPFSRYFAALGLAHIRKGGDMELDEKSANLLALAPVASVKDALQELYDSAEIMSKNMAKLVGFTVRMTDEQQIRLLNADFGEDPFNYKLARTVLPYAVWDPSQFQKARR